MRDDNPLGMRRDRPREVLDIDENVQQQDNTSSPGPMPSP
jgi:hypothetical protein